MTLMTIIMPMEMNASTRMKRKIVFVWQPSVPSSSKKPASAAANTVTSAATHSGIAGSFLGEYQAGGLILVLALHTDGRNVVGFFPCTGMHGGKMVFRGDVSNVPFPSQVTTRAATEEDRAEFAPYVREYCRLFGRDAEAMLAERYTVVTPDSKNPYQQMYVAN